MFPLGTLKLSQRGVTSLLRTYCALGLMLRSTEGSDRSGRCPSCNILAMFGDECDRLRPPPALEILSGSSFSFILEMLLFSSDRCKDD